MLAINAKKFFVLIFFYYNFYNWKWVVTQFLAKNIIKKCYSKHASSIELLWYRCWAMQNIFCIVICWLSSLANCSVREGFCQFITQNGYLSSCILNLWTSLFIPMNLCGFCFVLFIFLKCIYKFYLSWRLDLALIAINMFSITAKKFLGIT